jgi:hypothetical protein
MIFSETPDYLLLANTIDSLQPQHSLHPTMQFTTLISIAFLALASTITAAKVVTPILVACYLQWGAPVRKDGRQIQV